MGTVLVGFFVILAILFWAGKVWDFVCELIGSLLAWLEEPLGVVFYIGFVIVLLCIIF